MNTDKKSAIAVSAILLFSFISMIPFNNAYAQNSFDIDRYAFASSAENSAIAITPTNNYSWLIHGAGGTTATLTVYDGNSTIGTTNYTVVTGLTDEMRAFTVDSRTIIITGGSTTGTSFRSAVLNPDDSITTSNLSLSSCTLSSNALIISRVGSSLYALCTNGEIRVVSQTSLTQSASYSDMTSGTPTCTTTRQVMMISVSHGIAHCDNSLISFNISGSTITKLNSIDIGSASAITSYAYNNNIFWFSQGGLKFVPYNSSNGVFGDTTATLISGPTTGSFQPSGGTYFMYVDISETLWVFDTSIAPPNNLLFNQALSGVDIGTNLAIGSHDGNTFVISRGTLSSSSFPRYFVISNIIVNGFPISGGAGSGTTGGIDCNNPINANILICRITAQTGGNIGGLGGILDTGIFNIFTNAGLISGTDTNPQTNGVGYFITASAFMLMIGVFFVASKNNLDRIPNYIYMIVSIAILGGLTAIGWIDPTLLIIGIVIISGLAVSKYRDVLSGGFGGGDFR